MLSPACRAPSGYVGTGFAHGILSSTERHVHPFPGHGPQGIQDILHYPPFLDRDICNLPGKLVLFHAESFRVHLPELRVVPDQVHEAAASLRYLRRGEAVPLRQFRGFLPATDAQVDETVNDLLPWFDLVEKLHDRPSIHIADNTFLRAPY